MSDPDQLDPFLEELLDAGLSATEAADVAAGLVSPIEPTPDVRDRLMKSVAAGGRLHRFADDVARFLEVAADEAREMLDLCDDPESYGLAPLPGMAIFHVKGGPSVAAAITGFIKLPAGFFFPPHEHLGDELVYVVQGRFRDEDGTLYGPGDLCEKKAGTAHSFDVVEGPDLIYLAIVHGGIRIGEEDFLPGDPRI